jgi:hypothetical protein
MSRPGRAGLPAARVRGPVDVVIGAAVVLALYALTAVLKGQPATVSVILTAATVASGLWAAIEPASRGLGRRAALRGSGDRRG